MEARTLMIEALVVEDDLAQAQELIELLHTRGVSTTYARTAQEGESELLQTRFDYVLIDLMLPPSYCDEGLDLLRKLRARQPEAIPLLMTAREQGAVGIVSEAMTLGARYFFNKHDNVYYERVMTK